MKLHTLHLIATLLIVASFLAAPFAPAAPQQKGQPEYLQGLDALEAGKYSDAVTAFSAAIDADEERVAYWIARGVARALAQNFTAAEKDITRAQRLEPANQEARLWLSAITNMKGDFMQSGLIYQQATRDQYENAILDTSRAYGRLGFIQRSPDADADPEFLARARQERADALKKFPDIAAAFANHAKGAASDIAPLLFDRARQLVAKKDWAGALKDLQKASETNPRDVDILHFRALCNLNLGAPAAAREQFTRVLTADPAAAASFAGRACADVVMGDARRARIDLDHALQLDPARAAEFRKQFDEFAAANPAPQVKREELSNLLKSLHDAALKGATDDDLFKHATVLVKGAHANRLRADETYFIQRLDLEAGAKSGSPAALADLAQFLYRQAVTRHYEKVEPRSPMLPYRPQDTDAELDYALKTCDAALAKDPNNVKALTYKASCLMSMLQWTDAETLLRKALDIDPDYGPLLESFARCLNHAAAVRAMNAAGLRTTKTWEDLSYRYYRYPTQAELAQADELDAQAQRLWNLAKAHLDRAAQKYAGKPPGFYYAGVVARQRGQIDQAVAAFEQCVNLDPDHESAWDSLAELYSASGMPDRAAEAKSNAVNLTHTTAGHMLAYAWPMIARTKYRTARESIDKAIAYDAADPRSPAYLAVISAANDNTEQALAWYRTASAIEEARALLNGSSLRSGAGETLTADAAAFTLAVNDRLGRLALDQKHPDLAAQAFNRNIALESRVPKSQWFEPLWNSMLPDLDQGPAQNVPSAQTAIALFMWSRTGLGQALLAQGDQKGGLAQFQIVLDMPKLRHPTIDPGPTMGDPWATAKINLLKTLLAKNDIETAWKLSQQFEQPNGVSKELNDELGRITREIQDRRMRAEQADYDKQVEEARKQRQAELDKFMKQRQQQDNTRRQRPPIR
jgi:tetratricopeptide (TPR) repeat protein